ncbi:hypothetical protein CU098_002119 [Rhizopus stolonifer]|uniref:YegS/DAGK C-terminal domain-containing protein n=1 Tax=Rhizopus stolonifer TaxID=4846 RepID=A0A367JDX2_RHIST|nr:hypothetical protein CU098_002119 [Rhizopus stolonifer]
MRVQLGHATQDQDWEDHVVHDTDPIQLLVVMSWGFHAQVVSKARYLRYLMGNQRFSWVAVFLLKFLYQYEGELVLNHVQQYCLGEWQPEQDKIKLTQEKKFTYFLVSKQHSLEKGFKITPFASALTEDMDVLVLRDVDADTLTKASMDAFQGGQHVNSLEVEYFKAKQVLLRVKEKAELCLDGEIHQLPAKGVVDLQVISSGFTVFN